MVARGVGIRMERLMKLRGGSKSHEQQKENEQGCAHGPEEPMAETPDCPHNAHILLLDDGAVTNAPAFGP